MDKIILYTIHCPKCNVIQKKLDLKNISYDIIDDEETVTKFGEKNNISSAPILSVNDNVMDFSQSIKWIGEQG